MVHQDSSQVNADQRKTLVWFKYQIFLKQAFFFFLFYQMCFFSLVTSAFNAVWTQAALKEQNKIMLWYDQEIRKPDWTVWQSACRVYTGAGNAFEPLLPQTGNYKLPQTFPASFQISAYLNSNATNSVYIYNNPIPVNTGRLWDLSLWGFFFCRFPFFLCFQPSHMVSVCFVLLF